jgi:hypothetical protein
LYAVLKIELMRSDKKEAAVKEKYWDRKSLHGEVPKFLQAPGRTFAVFFV